MRLLITEITLLTKIVSKAFRRKQNIGVKILSLNIFQGKLIMVKPNEKWQYCVALKRGQNVVLRKKNEWDWRDVLINWIWKAKNTHKKQGKSCKMEWKRFVRMVVDRERKKGNHIERNIVPLLKQTRTRRKSFLYKILV